MTNARKAVSTVCFCLINCLFIKGDAKAQPLVFLPFANGDSWYCTQGQGGSYSHKGAQYYGFDFNKGSNLNNTSNPAYNKNLFSPINGFVVEIRDGVQDFQNNTSSNQNNNNGWGNTIVIRDEEGLYYVRLAHLKYGSLDHLDEGDWVNAGNYIGKIGQTGYSTSPHLHMQVMIATKGDSKPFMFVEGHVRSGDWVKSSLMPKASVLDNNGARNLSHDFSMSTVAVSGYWETAVSPKWFAGYNYRRHKCTGYSDTAYFDWRFTVGISGFYNIFASFPANAGNDPSAEYWFGSTVNPGLRVKTMDQSSGTTFFRWVTAQWLNKGQFYVVRLKGKTPNTQVVADAILLRRL